ncbi:MAG: hypothetical protein IPJ84_19120 [Bdellovibrionales bacterium]|nr:hypothetical protein [Bdellovibrionales bacterium]MBK7892882.1 hypothetical protein [Bdellovibrionales bacterium]
MRFITQWLLVLLTVLNPILANAALTDFDRQELAFENLLAPYNSGFESGKAKWTASGGTLAAVTSGTNLLAGKGSATWDAGASGQTLTSQAITIPKGYYGLDCEVEILAQVPSGTATHYVRAYDGTNVQAYQAIISSTTPRWNPVTFPCPQSGTIALQIYANADEPLIAVDVGYIGRSKRVGSTQLISEWASFTPTGSWSTNTTYQGKWRRDGDTMYVQIKVDVTGAPTSASLTVNIPSGYTIDTTKLTASSVETVLGELTFYDSSATRTYPGQVLYNSTTSLLARSMGGDEAYVYNGVLNQAAPQTFANGDSVTIKASFPIVGWTAQTTASIDAISKRGSISFASGSSTVTSGSLTTFNVAGFGTNTLEGQALAPTTANDFGIRMTGAPAAMYEVTASGKFYASSAATTGTRTICEFRWYDGTNYSPSVYAIAPGGLSVESNDSVATITGLFQLSSAGTINVVLRGQRVSGNGTCYAEAGAYISIKNVSQNSPAIVIANSVSTGIANGRVFDTATVLCSSSSSITRDLGGLISSIGNISSGTCSLTLAAGKFSAAPDIVTNLNANAANDTKPAANCTSATACTISYYCSGSACTSAAATVFLSGPR